MSTPQSEPRRVVRLGAAALWYAEQGVAVFPVQPGGKRPAGALARHGLKDAATDPATVRAWWSAEPKANIGLPTGLTFDVVDVDGFEGQASRAKLWCELGCDDPECSHPGIFGDFERELVGKVLTPRPGGMHLYIPARSEYGNGASLAPGVDYRGRGGYVVAPPSVNEQGTYRWLSPPRLGHRAPTR